MVGRLGERRPSSLLRPAADSFTILALTFSVRDARTGWRQAGRWKARASRERESKAAGVEEWLSLMLQLIATGSMFEWVLPQDAQRLTRFASAMSRTEVGGSCSSEISSPSTMD